MLFKDLKFDSTPSLKKRVNKNSGVMRALVPRTTAEFHFEPFSPCATNPNTSSGGRRIVIVTLNFIITLPLFFWDLNADGSNCKLLTAVLG
jgi:hypothetical protein